MSEDPRRQATRRGLLVVEGVRGGGEKRYIYVWASGLLFSLRERSCCVCFWFFLADERLFVDWAGRYDERKECIILNI